MTAPPHTSPDTAGPLRVLLVDDEERVLRGLYRLMRRDPGIALQISGSAHEALQLLAVRDFDVVVSDLHMPGMGGDDLLRRVRTQHPETVRVMLSGSTDADALNSLQVAHQFLRKPCGADDFRAAMSSAASLRPLLRSDELRSIINSSASLPSAPTAWLALEALLKDPDVSSHDVGEVVAGDVAMATKVLQIVNSAFTGLRRRITNVPDAVAYLGVDTIRSLVLSVEVFHMFERADAVPAFSVERLSVHARASAGLARRMTPQRKVAEAAATAALLQDVGQLLQAEAMPVRMAGLLAECVENAQPLHVVERERTGCTHADVGAYLLRLWGLPAEVADAVAASHYPLGESVASPTAAEVTAIAHAVVQCYRPDSQDPTDPQPHDRLRADIERAVGHERRKRWAAVASSGQEQENDR